MLSFPEIPLIQIYVCVCVCIHAHPLLSWQGSKDKDDLVANHLDKS